MFVITLLIMSLAGFIVGNFMTFTVKILPEILLEGCERGREPRDIFKLFLKEPLRLRSDYFLELSIALLFFLSTLIFPLNSQLIYVLAVSCILVCCFFTDYQYGILPDQLTLTLVWIGLIGSLLPVTISPDQSILGAVFGYGTFWFFNEIYRYLKGFDGMYPGDFKLNAGIGACLGIKLLIPVVGISLVLLLVVNIIKIFYDSNKIEASHLYKEIPYACSITFIAIAANYLLLLNCGANC